MKKIVRFSPVLALAIGGLFWTGRPAKGQQDFFFTLPFEDIAKGYKISPVPITIGNRDPFLVGWGSYLVNAASGCVDCHTNPTFIDGGDPYMGQPKKINASAYLAGGVDFGPFTSRNITPQANGLPAGLTFEQFHQAMTTGLDPDKAHPQFGPFLQVMPWPSYQEMSTRQLRAIYEYLSSIPPVQVQAH